MSENNVPATNAVKKAVVNCPKCSTSLNVKLGNYAYVCPVCNQIFRTRIGERLVKDISNNVSVEAYMVVDKDAVEADVE